MGIHDPGGNLYKLTDMSHKKNALYAHINGHVNGLSYIIAALDIVLKGNRHMLSEIIRTVIPRCHQDIVFSLAEMLLHLHMDAFDQSLLTHGLYDPAGSKYGDPAKNAKTGIKGFLRDLFPLRDGYGKLQTALVVIFLGRLFGFPQDHGSGNRIDCRFPHVLGKSRLGDTPHTDPTVQDDLRPGFLCFLLLPGLFYHEPPRQDRRIPQETTEAGLLVLLDRPDAAMRLDKWLLAHFAGLSPLIARELSFRFAGETDAPIPTLDAARLAAFLTAEFAALPPVQMQPMLLWKDGAPTDFTYRDIRQYGGYLRAEPCESFSALLDRFYTETDHAERMRQRSQTLRKAISNLHERTRRKLELQRQELEATHDREQLRRQGDIVTANLHAITRGQTLLRAEDFYDENLREIEIPLKPNLSPQQNAARFYKDYARAKHAEQVLTQQIAQGEIEEAYLGGVLEELARAENERDLSEIRAELEAGGYVRPADRRKQGKQQPSKPMHFRSSDGFDIFVGRNNRQNDQLSLKTARRDDLWLHVQKFHGTHVIIACAGIQPPDETITEAAELAAYYSEARESQNVPVDVTPVRCLRKPNGAKPGMVVYDRYRTVLVTPDAALPARLRVE